MLGLVFFLTVLLRYDLYNLKFTSFKYTLQRILVYLQSYISVTTV